MKGGYLTGKKRNMTNYVHTLCWNMPWEVEKATRSLYELNDKEDFVHVIVDLGFPLIEDKIPEDIEDSKKKCSGLIEAIAKTHGSLYVKIDNKGVSQNWTSVYKWLKENHGFTSEDNLICADPDERPIHKNWVKAVGTMLSYGYGWACLAMPEYFKCLRQESIIEDNKEGYRVWELIGNINWAQGGFSGKFLEEEGGVPYLEEYPIYGHIETASILVMEELGYKWCILPDFLVKHTDYEQGSEGSSRLLRLWKNDIVFGDKQITFEEWLKK